MAFTDGLIDAKRSNTKDGFNQHDRHHRWMDKSPGEKGITRVLRNILAKKRNTNIWDPEDILENHQIANKQSLLPAGRISPSIQLSSKQKVYMILHSPRMASQHEYRQLNSKMYQKAENRRLATSKPRPCTLKEQSGASFYAPRASEA
ncbi:unnamed protein product [Protopolystoma xenopodis]|uniref:Uncharacterized protein n=1 Tax=Protopolystoma xenopodis TaxID=117903 RepID=A0A448X4Q0_9PLAT|nr:unnamed protein product [Protopolystoma xenopodis]